jgi:hypothetical protein
MYPNDIDVDILVNGKPVKKYSHLGKTFVESKHWTEYVIRIKNNSCYRRLVVISVDGLNVLDGEAGGITKAGYVINGYNSLEISGFRTSDEVVHPFKFSRKEYSYAAKSDVTEGDTSNCGVIGIKVYEEKEKPYVPPITIIREIIKESPTPQPWNPPPWSPTWDTTTAIWSSSATKCCNGQLMSNNDTPTYASASCGCGGTVTAAMSSCIPQESPLRGFDMGTEFSEREVQEKVYEVGFEIGRFLNSTSLYYASREALIDMGVPIIKKTQMSFPEPFPRKFCRPPSR